jgi:DNA-binding GntR family transcriptional regulator
MTKSYTLQKVDTSLSLKDKAYAAIKDAILTLELEPGTPLVESDLADQLGISKTPVRDALQELERDGLVTRLPFKGTYVTEVTERDLREIFQLRAVLEGLAARLATSLLTPQELDELDHNLSAAEDALARGDLALCSRLGKSVHDAIIEKADNVRLISMIRNLDESLLRFRALSDRTSGRLDKSLREHRRILDALRRQDAYAAEESVRDHLHSVLENLCGQDQP